MSENTRFAFECDADRIVVVILRFASTRKELFITLLNKHPYLGHVILELRYKNQ